MSEIGAACLELLAEPGMSGEGSMLASASEATYDWAAKIYRAVFNVKL